MATTASRTGDLAERIQVRQTTDRVLLRAFLDRDRLFAAYAICDLDDREFHRTRWGGAFDGDRLLALAMEYVGLSPQPLFVMGEPDAVTAILRGVIRPRAAYVASLAANVPAVEKMYRLGAGPPMVRMWVDRTHFRPYPAGVQRLLLDSGYDPAGKHVVICGRSNIVGKPLAAILMQKAPGANATVTICHTRTQNLAEITRRADILVAAMGSPRAITADMVREGAVVIDVGNNTVEDASRKSGYRLVGDVDFDAVVEKAAAITPVPGGVGPMTVAMVVYNTVLAAGG